MPEGHQPQTDDAYRHGPQRKLGADFRSSRTLNDARRRGGTPGPGPRGVGTSRATALSFRRGARHCSSYADRCFDIMGEYAPNFRQSVIARQVLAPKDIEERYGLTGGNIFQGAMTLDQLFFLRPLPGYADYRTPIKGLYLCGAATHPGGGVMGACGYNAANEILRDL